MTTETIPADKFETQTCGRCGGCGQYSYCQMYGTRCFGCGGTGKKYTKRGQAARTFYLDSFKKPAKDFVVGEWFANEVGSKVKPVQITKIETYVQRGSSLRDGVMVPYEMTMLSLMGNGYAKHVAEETPVREVFSAEVNAAKKAAALAYQQTLTKAGKPRKTKG